MTIKTQQRALLVVIGLIFAVMLGIVFQSNRVTAYYQNLNQAMTGIITEVSHINLVTGDYLRNHHDRPLLQIEWQLLALVSELDKVEFNRPENRATHAGMKEELGRAQQLFARLQEVHKRIPPHADFDFMQETDPFASGEIEDLAINLSLSSAALSTSAHSLLKSLAQAQREELSFYGRLLMGGLIFSFALLTLSLLLSSRRLVRSVESLQAGAARIASGDLQSKIALVGRDELTDLTRSINEMSEKLLKSRAALENEIEERKQVEAALLASEQELRQNEEEINQLNKTLANQLLKLQVVNREMESFTYSVSHDLRAPLRHLAGFVELLEMRDSSGLDEKSRHYLQVIAAAARKMGCLIDDLLSFSRMGRGEMMKDRVDLGALSREVIAEISSDLPPSTRIDWRIGELPIVSGDRAMLRLTLVNLITNAVKFSQHVETPVIEMGTLPPEEDNYILYIRDNGAGFDMKYVEKLFGLFQRLHSAEEYEGTGVGLANVQRIIGRHGGRIWAEGELNKGATFYFTLPQEKELQP